MIIEVVMEKLPSPQGDLLMDNNNFFVGILVYPLQVTSSISSAFSIIFLKTINIRSNTNV